MSQGRIVSERRGGIVILTLERPERKNAFTWKMLDELAAACAAVASDAQVSAVVITGAGGAFSAGADVSPDNPGTARLFEAIERRDLTALRTMIEEIRVAFDRVAALPMPVVAAIEGVAYGGGAELALACDLRVAAQSSVLCFSETKLGFLPDLGGTVRLTQLLGPGRAKELIFTARKVTAAEALDMGLVNRTAAQGEAVSVAQDLAQEIASRGPTAVRLVKRLVNRIQGTTMAEAIALEAEAAAHTLLCREFLEGVQAFFEKRPPRW